MRPRRILVVLVLASAHRLGAQVFTNTTATPIGRASMAERNGNYAEAAAQYAVMLKAQPANVDALLGMEHVLPHLGRKTELGSLVAAALAADSTSVGVLGRAMHIFVTLGHADSAQKYTERWSARAPGDDEPYREWYEAAIDARDVVQARVALDLGRARLGAGALGIELAQMLQRSGDYAGATREWIGVLHGSPSFRDAIVGVLAPAAGTQRQSVRDGLVKDGTRESRQVLGLLLVQWGSPADGAAMTRAALPDDPVAAEVLLRTLLAGLRARDDHPSLLAAAATLEALAARETGAEHARTFMDAARSYADAGDERNARRVLAVVAASPDAPSGMASAASTTLLGVLIAEGKAADAERVLKELGPSVTLDEHDQLARRIAMAWVRTGDFGRAEQLVARDSSTEGFDLRGRLRLFQGDLAGAHDLLKFAGPYGDDREQALQRVALLALIQAIGRDSLPALGHALLALARADSSGAISALAALADTLKPGGGPAETRLLAARLALATRDTARALQLLRLADVKEAPATAAAARLDEARISAAAGRTAEARTVLEQLIIDFPESAVVPEARRMRDTLPVGAAGR